MRVESMVMSWQQGSPLILSKSVGGTGAMKSTSPASSAETRVAGSLIGVKHDPIDIAGRGLVPIIGEALEFELHPLLALGDDERPVPPTLFEAKDAPCLEMSSFGFPRSSVPE